MVSHKVIFNMRMIKEYQLAYLEFTVNVELTWYLHLFTKTVAFQTVMPKQIGNKDFDDDCRNTEEKAPKDI